MKYYMVRNDELCHHGIKGQKWGVRRYQNSDGTLTAAGRKRYSYEDLRPDDPYERSSNVFLNGMGGRRINADYETRRARGEKLVKDNRTAIGAVGRHVARGMLFGLVGGMAASAVGALSGTLEGQAAANRALGALTTVYSVSSIIRTYQDVADMKTYKDSEAQKKTK